MMKRRSFLHDDALVHVKAERSGSELSATIAGAIEKKLGGRILMRGPGNGIWKVNGHAHRITAVEHQQVIWVAVDGRIFQLHPHEEGQENGDTGSAGNQIVAPMPGKVIKLFVAEGDTVAEGDPILIVEAMKMEHTLRAPFAGRIAALQCSEGEQVSGNVPLVELEPIES